MPPHMHFQSIPLHSAKIASLASAMMSGLREIEMMEVGDEDDADTDTDTNADATEYVCGQQIYDSMSY